MSLFWLLFLILVWMILDMSRLISFEDQQTELLIWRFGFFVGTFLGLYALKFSVVFLGIPTRRSLEVAAFFLYAICGAFIVWTNKVVLSITNQNYFGEANFVPGHLFAIELILVVAPLLLATLFVFMHYIRKKNGHEKKCLFYILLGFCFPLFFAPLVNIVFPFFGFNFPRLGFFFIFLGAVFFSYALYACRAFDISVFALSIRNKIIIPFGIIGIIIITCISYFYYAFGKEEIERQKIGQMHSITESKAAWVSSFLTERRDDVELLSKSTSVRFGLDRDMLVHVKGAKDAIQDVAERVATQVGAYIATHPDNTLEDMQHDSVFQDLAVQEVGKTGYTAVTDYDSLIARAHKSPGIVDLNLHSLSDKLPGFWSIMSKTQGGNISDGFYDWKEADGSFKEKYMYIDIVPGRTHDGVGLSVAATTYLEEYDANMSLLKRAEEYFRNMVNLYGYTNIYLVAEDGNVVLSYPEGGNEGKNILESEYKDTAINSVFIEVLRTTSGSMSDYEIKVDQHHPTLFVGSMVTEEDSQETLGVVIVEVDDEDINHIVNSKAGLVAGEQSFVIGKDGLLRSAILQPSQEYQASNISIDTENKRTCFSHLDSQKDEETETDMEYFEYRNHENKIVLGVHRYIPEMDWCLITEIEKKQILEPVMSLARDIIFFGFGLFILAIYILRRIIHMITAPLQELESNVHEVESGNLDYVVSTTSRDEIGQLSRAFQSMVEAVKRSNAEVKTKVKKQTKEIEKRKVELESQQAAMLNVLEDLSEDKKIIALEMAKDEAALNNIGDGLVAINKEGMVTVMNKAAEQLFDISAKKILGKDSEEIEKKLFVLGDEASPKKPFHEALKNKETIFHQTYTIQNNEKKNIIVSVISSPIKMGEKIIGSISIFRNVTEEMELERSKKDFVSIASHQLRTPLSAMRWYIEELKDGEKGKLSEGQQDYVHELYDSVIRLNELVNDLLNASRLETGRMAIIPRKTDFISLVDSILKDFKVVAGARNCIVTLKKPSLKTLRFSFDPALIRESISNLISNAIHYSSGGKKKCSIYVIIKKTKDHVELSVRDSGIGIPKDQQKNIFHKFFRATTGAQVKTEGSGLGLYITKLVVEESGGSISFVSKEGVGTTFTMRLPLRGSRKKDGEKGIEQKSI
ncbi:MAG: ATP-binding protein [Candidatus Magasanikbacteria bacterium]